MILLMQFFLPKEIIKNYFKTPYFNEFELSLFRGPFFSQLRTIMFLVVIAFPNRGSKRNLTELNFLVSPRYRFFSSVLILSVVACSLLLMLVGLLIGILALFGL